jgi:fatty acid CoA ligase FadD32
MLTALQGRKMAVFCSPASFLCDPLLWPRMMSHHRATHTQAPNFAYHLTATRMLAAQASGFLSAASLDLTNLRSALNGAEAVHAPTLRLFAAAFAPAGFRVESFTAAYGLAEHVVYVAGAVGSLETTPSTITVSQV